MIQFVAPFAAPTSIVILPNYEFTNTQSLTSSVRVKQTIDNTMYVYKKTKDHQKLQWSFVLTPAKAEELKAAVDFYVGEFIKLVDFDGTVWRVLLSNESFSFVSRTADNWVEVQLEFQGVQVNG
jgi:hypothetical protein